MQIFDQYRLGTIALGNFATGGVIGTAAATVNISSAISINQTTAGQVLTLPIPTDTTHSLFLAVSNVGTAPFVIEGAALNANSSVTFVFTGSTWRATGSGSGASGWGLTGNTGTTQAISFLGTPDNVGLSFRTNNLIRATITSGGNFGVGTTAPTATMESAGSFGVGIEESAAAAVTATDLSHTIVLTSAGLQTVTLQAAAGRNRRTLRVVNPINNVKQFNIAYTDLLGGANTVIQPFTSMLLQSDGAIWRVVSQSDTGTGTSGWGLTGNGGTTQATSFIGTTDNVGLSLRTNNVIRQTINNVGSVGFGTTAPLGLVDVAGGRNNGGGAVAANADLAFQFGSGGFRHFLSTEHDSSGDSPGNRFVFWVNTGVTSGASIAPNTGNQAVASFTGSGAVLTTGTTSARTIIPTSPLNLQDLSSAGAAADAPLGIDAAGNVRRSSGTKTVDTKTASYTLVATDANKIIAVNSATATTITLSGLTSGQSVQVYQQGAGQISFATGTLTRRHNFNLFNTAGQFSMIEVTVVGADAVLTGALA
jgi:hypothetical protein